MEFSNLPPNLNVVADQWRSFLANVPTKITKDLSLHTPGSISVYQIDIILRRQKGDLTFYYVGQSGDPNTRANTHKSELLNCKTTIRTGKAHLYNPEYFDTIKSIDMVYRVVSSGFNSENAKDAEKKFADQLEQLYENAVLTRPRGNQKRS